MCNTNEETAHSHFTIIIDVYRNPYPPPSKMKFTAIINYYDISYSQVWKIEKALLLITEECPIPTPKAR